MPKIFLLSTLTLCTFIACQKRVCPQTQTYNGLYNALTCDYQSQTFNLEQNLSHSESKKVALQKKKNSLKNKVDLQENQIIVQKKQLENKELLLTDIKEEVDNINAATQTKKILKKLNLQIKNMHKALKEKSY